MSGFSDWAPANSQRVLPFAEPVSEWQYRAFIDWHFFASQFRVTDIVQINGGWYLQLFDPGSDLIFEQKVALTLNLIGQIALSLGELGLAFFTWFGSNIQVNTTMPADGWKHTIGGTQIAEPGFLETGGGTEVSNNEGIVDDWYDSTVYLIDIPVGTTEKIRWDNISEATVNRTAQFQWRAKLAGAWDAMVDTPGALRVARPTNNQIIVRHSYGSSNWLQGRAVLTGVESPKIWKDATNRLWIAGIKDHAYQLWYSLDDGLSLVHALYPDTVIEMANQPIVIWDTKIYKYPDIAHLASGDAVSIAQANGNIYLKRSVDNWLNARLVGPSIRTEQYNVRVQETASGRAEIVVTNALDDTYRSNDGGFSFVRDDQ